MDLERIDQGFVEVQRGDELPSLPKQAVRNAKIAEAHDAHQLAGVIAIAGCCNLRCVLGLFDQHDTDTLCHCLVFNPENDGTEQRI